MRHLAGLRLPRAGRRTLALAGLVTLLAAGSAQAENAFRITAGGNQDWGPSTGAIDQTSSSQLEATGTMTGDSNSVGTVDYHMQAGPGIVRAALEGNVTVPSNLNYPFNPSLQAVAATDL